MIVGVSLGRMSFENDIASGSAETGSMIVGVSLGRMSFEKERPSGSATAASMRDAFHLCQSLVKNLVHALTHSV